MELKELQSYRRWSYCPTVCPLRPAPPVSGLRFIYAMSTCARTSCHPPALHFNPQSLRLPISPSLPCPVPPLRPQTISNQTGRKQGRSKQLHRRPQACRYAHMCTCGVTCVGGHARCDVRWRPRTPLAWHATPASHALLHYRLLTLCPAPTDPVGQSSPRGTGSVGRGAQGQ